MVSRVGEWAFVNTPNPPPATGQLRLNTVSQTAATRIFIHKTTATSVDATNYLMSVTAGQEIYFQDKDNFTKWQVYKVMIPPTNVANYVDYTVEWVRGGGIDVPQQRIFMAIDEELTEEVLSSPFAFPSITAFGISMGLTIRQYYAAELAKGFITSGVASNLTGGQMAEWAFTAADSMIEYERKQAAGIPAPPVGSPTSRQLRRPPRTPAPVLRRII